MAHEADLEQATTKRMWSCFLQASRAPKINVSCPHGSSLSDDNGSVIASNSSGDTSSHLSRLDAARRASPTIVLHFNLVGCGDKASVASMSSVKSFMEAISFIQTLPTPESTADRFPFVMIGRVSKYSDPSVVQNRPLCNPKNNAVFPMKLGVLDPLHPGVIPPSFIERVSQWIWTARAVETARDAFLSNPGWSQWPHERATIAACMFVAWIQFVPYSHSFPIKSPPLAMSAHRRLGCRRASRDIRKIEVRVFSLL